MFIDIFLNGEMSEFLIASVIAENGPKRIIGNNELFVVGIFKGEFFDIIIDELSDFDTGDERRGRLAEESAHDIRDGRR
jgi:hypothetical protein